MAVIANAWPVAVADDPRAIEVADQGAIVVITPRIGVGVAQLGIALLLRLLAIRPLLAALGLAFLGGEPFQVGIARRGVGILGRARLGVGIVGRRLLVRRGLRPGGLRLGGFCGLIVGDFGLGRLRR